MRETHRVGKGQRWVSLSLNPSYEERAEQDEEPGRSNARGNEEDCAV
jgi:hypothetical protein